MSERASKSGVSRREFVRMGALGGAALVLGISGDRVRVLSPREAKRRTSATFAPSQWIRIDASGDVTRHPLNRRHPPGRQAAHRNGARPHRAPLHMHRARPARPHPAPELRPRQIQLVAQHPEQGSVGRGGDVARAAVDCEKH